MKFPSCSFATNFFVLEYLNYDTTYNGKEGLLKATTELREIDETTGEIPKAKDRRNNKRVRIIFNAVYRGEWEKFGINVGHWKDLIIHVFGKDVYRKEIKTYPYSLGIKPMR
ncbi:MAG: hypothetical protein ACFFCQ_14315 [Promethearchaeota archaeon]